ncbi:MAG TPA: von Willebrand factor type A domain-containing protein [Kofleriaceae bacterium]|nr:von Willebrand factor type A domain-containing protein [Kofleriaceae bacterium]
MDKGSGASVGQSAGSGSGAAPTGEAAGSAAYLGTDTGATASGGYAGAPAMKVAVADPQAGEGYKDYGTNAWTDAAQDRLSTFAADVDTASYSIVRRKLGEGSLPPAAAVRVEEFVNYFRYAYGAPAAGEAFAVHMDAAPSPFNSGRHILRVGVSTKAKSIGERKKMNLVFLVDVSGSMQSIDKLELAKRSLRILVDNLKDGDTVALVTYAGSTRVVLPATGLEHKGQILAALDELTAGGSTGMGSGIDLAYKEAMKGLAPDAESRVIILSDGDANVGPTSHQGLLDLIAGKVKEGVMLSTIGFGMGNYQDETMEQLANKGNGNNYYIDGLSQAKRVFAEQIGSTLEVVAQDVKLQVDFDPRMVARYRLVGYENRNLADDSFRDDKVDAGEVGAGHQVTALYEVELVKAIDKSYPLATVHVRHKVPKATKASEAVFAFAPTDLSSSFAGASADLRFAFATAAFADVLRGAEDAEHWDLAEIKKIAAAAAGDDADRKELVGLIDQARQLKGGSATLAK